MNYIQYPSFVTTIDGTARLRFDSNEDFVILKSTDKTRKLLELTKPKRNESYLWFDAPSNIDKDFYFEVIDGKTICYNLLTDISIFRGNELFGKKYKKTGRKFEL